MEPRCFAILKPDSAILDPITKRNRVRTPEERKDPIRRRIEAARKLNGQLKLKERLAAKNRELAKKKRAARLVKEEFNVDIWNEEAIKPLTSEWLTPDTLRHTLAHTEFKRKKVPNLLQKKPSVIPAVEAPHPGTSYNPSYKDHQELLATVAEKEVKLMKEEAHLNRVTTKMFQKVSAKKKDENMIQELSEGLPSKTDENKDRSSDDEYDESAGTVAVNLPVENVKKTLVKRRKQKEQKILKRKLAEEKMEKKKIADIYKLKFLNKRMAAKEKKEEILRKKRLKLKEIKSTEPRTLSRIKFEPAEPDFQMGNELAGNLRSSEPIGNLLKDRFKSLQQRNILAPSTLALKRCKAKVKKYERDDHKMGWEGTFK